MNNYLFLDITFCSLILLIGVVLVLFVRFVCCPFEDDNKNKSANTNLPVATALKMPLTSDTNPVETDGVDNGNHGRASIPPNFYCQEVHTPNPFLQFDKTRHYVYRNPRSHFACEVDYSNPTPVYKVLSPLPPQPIAPAEMV
jgi:hypothetical protein